MLIEVEDVNAYLPQDKWQLDALNSETRLINHVQNRVKEKLSSTYDVTGWTGFNDTPLLIRGLIGMFVAAYIYNRQFADEAADAGSYGNWLLKSADDLLDSIYEGLVQVEGEEPTLPRSEPGHHLTEPVFTMGETF